MSIRLEKPFRPAVSRLRGQLDDRELALFDLLCSAGQLGYRLPDDDINLRAGAGPRDPRKRLIREYSIAAGSAEVGAPPLRDWARAGERLVRRLTRELAETSLREEDRALRVLLAYAPIALAPDCVIPRDPFLRAAWDTALQLFAKLFPSAVKALGPLECVQRRLPTLRREAAAGLRIGRLASGQKPGREGSKLAIDPELIARVGKALGKKLATGYMARYLFYTKAGDHIWPHPDDPKFAVTVLICVQHEILPDSSFKSAFLAYSANGSAKRYELTPGCALAVEPGLIHAREPVRKGERVALLSIGLCLA